MLKQVSYRHFISFTITLKYKWDPPVIQSTNEVSEPNLEPIYVFSVGKMSNWKRLFGCKKYFLATEKT